MSDTNIPKPIGGIDDLEIAAKDAAAQLGKATSHNAIWDKAAKALKQGLSALAKTREDAKAEATQANKLMESLAENYDNDVVSDRIRGFPHESGWGHRQLGGSGVHGRASTEPCQGRSRGSEKRTR